MSAKWKELVQEYKNTCTVPKHPKKCPDCDSKVSIHTVESRKQLDLYYSSNLNITRGKMQKTYSSI